MLVEFGERRQVLSITCDDLDVLLQNVKDAFGVVSAGSLYIIQKSDREWEDWIDVTAASSIVNRDKLKLKCIKENCEVSFIRLYEFI